MTWLVAASLLVGADTVLWLAALDQLRSRAGAWIAQAGAQGWSVSTGLRHGGGWPFAAVLTIDRAGIAGGERNVPGGMSWSADRVVLSLGLAHPLTLHVAAQGQQFLRLSHLPDIAFTAGSAGAWLPLLAGRSLAGRLRATAIGAGIAGSAHPQDVQVEALAIDLREDRAAPGATLSRARLDVRANGIGLPDIGHWPLGATVTSAGATLLLASPVLPDHPLPLAAGQTRAAAQAAAWRDGGGSLAVRDAELRWGPLSAHGSADMHLDAQLQPAGSGIADVAGTQAALDAAAKGGLIPPGVALTAQAVLAVMPGVAGSDAVRLPFVVRDRTLSVGRIPVATMEAVGWYK